MSEEWHAVLRGTQWVSVHERSEGLGRVNTHHICTSSTTEAQEDNCEGRINKLPSINNGNCLFVGKKQERESVLAYLSSLLVQFFSPTLNSTQLLSHFPLRPFIFSLRPLAGTGRSVTQRSRSFFIVASVTSGDLLVSPWFHCIIVQVVVGCLSSLTSFSLDHGIVTNKKNKQTIKSFWAEANKMLVMSSALGWVGYHCVWVPPQYGWSRQIEVARKSFADSLCPKNSYFTFFVLTIIFNSKL